MSVIESEPSSLLTTRLSRGVLIVRIEVSSLMHQSAVKRVESELLQALPHTATAVVVDCEQLTLHVSTEFLSTLVYVRKMAKKCGVTLAVCNLSKSMLATYEVTALAPLIPAFDSLEVAIGELGCDEVAKATAPTARNERPRRYPSQWMITVIAITALAAWLAAAYFFSNAA